MDNLIKFILVVDKMSQSGQKILTFVVLQDAMTIHFYCNYLLYRHQWMKAVVVKLFIEHVCTQVSDIKRCMTLWGVSIIPFLLEIFNYSLYIFDNN